MPRLLRRSPNADSIAVSRTKQIARVALYASAGLLGAGVLLVFALTRTEFGREALRQEIVRSYANRYEGRLHIEALQGNFRQQILASDVRLLDRSGNPWLTVDSLVTRPRWWSLVRGRFSIRSLEAIRPALVLRTDSAGSVSSPLVRRQASGGAAGTWTPDRIEVQLADGTVRMHRIGIGPSQALDSLHVQAVYHRNQVSNLLDVVSFSGRLPEMPLTIHDASAQLVTNRDRIVFNRLVVAADQGNLDLTGIVSDYREPDSLSMDLSLHVRQLELRALRKHIPTLALADTLDGAVTVRGNASRLTADNLLLAFGTSSLVGNGNLLLNGDSLGLQLNVREALLRASDIRALLPEARLPEARHLGMLRLQGAVQTVHTPQAIRIRTSFDLESEGGSASGTASIGRPAGGQWAYTGSVQTSALDFGFFSGDTALESRIDGSFSLEGSGLGLHELEASIGAELGPSSLARRPLDGMRADVTLRGRTGRTEVQVWKEDQFIDLAADFDWTGQRPSVNVDSRMRNVDVGSILFSDSLYSSLNGTWHMSGSGLPGQDLQGRLSLQVDSSSMGWGGTRRTVAPHEWMLALGRSANGGFALDVDGDALAMRLESSHSFRIDGSLAALWRVALADALQRQQDKYRIGPEGHSHVAWPPLEQLILQGEAAAMLAGSAARGPVKMEGSLAIKQSEIVSSWLPMTASFATDFVGALSVQADADSLAFRATASADSILWRTTQVAGLKAAADGRLTLEGPLEHTVTAEIDAEADHWHVRGPALEGLRVTASLEDAAADVALSTEGAVTARVQARLMEMGDRYRLRFGQLAFSSGAYRWNQAEDAIIDVFADALEFVQFRLESAASHGMRPQGVDVTGVLSSSVEDTLSVGIRSLALRQLSDFVEARRSFGGTLDGRLRWTGLERPEVSGDVVVTDLRLENHVLGRLEASSRFDPGSPDIAVVASLGPAPGENSGEGDTLRFVENNLTIAGTVRLPGRDNDGALDLDLDVRRADAFFFEYLVRGFHDVSGAFVGGGTIGGTFGYPVFDAGLTLREGSFRIPDHGMRYAAEADTRITREGIAIDRLALSDSTGGRAEIAGMMHFNDYRYFSFDVAGNLDELQIMNIDAFTRQIPFYGLIWVSGDATLTGPLNNAFLRSVNLQFLPRSDLYIPIVEADAAVDPGFIIYADSTGRIPETAIRPQRETILDRRQEGERDFAAGLQMDLNILAPEGSSIHLVIDPLLGDVINGTGSGRVQLQLREGDLATYGIFAVESGDYLFTAGELFVRRFLINEGTIAWTGDPLNPQLDISADYRTRASRNGLPAEVGGALQTSLPLIVGLQISGELNAVQIAPSLAVDQRQEAISDTPLLEAYLNQPDRAAQHATSVLITNSFLLSAEGGSSDVLAGSAFNSVSNLVASQLNRYISQVIPNADLTLGVLSDESAEELDVSAGIALRLLDERLVIRGQGVYRGLRSQPEAPVNEGLEGELLVEIQLSPSISVEVFYRREGDVLSETLITSETGAGINYHAEFTSWRSLIRRIFGRRRADEEGALGTR